MVQLVCDGGLIAYPTVSCFALGCQLGNSAALNRIREIRDLDKHHFTLVCRDLAQPGQFLHLSNAAFQLINASTSGPVNLHPAGDEGGSAPTAAPQKEDCRSTDPPTHRRQTLLAELDDPLLSSTPLRPDEPEPLTQGWEITDRLDMHRWCGPSPVSGADEPALTLRNRGAGSHGRGVHPPPAR